MKLLNTIENYATNIILKDNCDEIQLERLSNFRLINDIINTNDDINYRANMYLIAGLDEYKKSHLYRLLYESVLELYVKKRYNDLENTYKKLECINDMPKLYKYFFNKLKIEYKMEIFNNSNLCDDELDEYPSRIKIENSFDLVKEIKTILNFLRERCFENKIFDINYMNVNIKKYYYFVKLLKYYLDIIPEVKKKFNFEYLVLEKIVD